MLLAGLASLSMGNAHAEDRPTRYDVDAHCSELANTNDGFSPEVMQRCLIAQNDALDRVKRIWAATPAYIQRDCDARARLHGEDDYAVLEKCIQDQLRQALPDVTLPRRR